MKSLLILAAALSVSVSASAGYNGLPYYTTSSLNIELSNKAAIQDALDKCKADIEEQKNILKVKGYAIVEESQCAPGNRIQMSSGDNVSIHGSITFLK